MIEMPNSWAKTRAILPCGKPALCWFDDRACASGLTPPRHRKLRGCRPWCRAACATDMHVGAGGWDCGNFRLVLNRHAGLGQRAASRARGRQRSCVVDRSRNFARAVAVTLAAFAAQRTAAAFSPGRRAC